MPSSSCACSFERTRTRKRNMWCTEGREGRGCSTKNTQGMSRWEEGPSWCWSYASCPLPMTIGETELRVSTIEETDKRKRIGWCTRNGRRRRCSSGEHKWTWNVCIISAGRTCIISTMERVHRQHGSECNDDNKTSAACENEKNIKL